MVENLKILMMTEKHKYRSVSAYVDATLAFDPHRGSKDMIERIQYKEKSNSYVLPLFPWRDSDA